MPQTKAVYYRDKRGVESVDRFINALPAKRAAKIDAYIEEHLNGRSPSAPPPEHPITSQIEGELRELRVRSPTPGIGSSTSALATSSCCCTIREEHRSGTQGGDSNREASHG